MNLWSTNKLRGNLEKVAQFLVVAETGSILKASQALNIAQPALSRTMQSLESALGVRLFQRGRKGVILTPAGARLRDRSTPLLRELSNVVHALVREGESGHQVVGISTHEVLVGLFVPRLIAALKEGSPRIAVTLRTATSTSAMLDDLANHVTDICFAAEPKPRAQIQTVEVMALHYGLFCTKSFYAKHCRRIAPIKALTELDPAFLIYADKVLASEGQVLGDVMERLGVKSQSSFDVKSIESVAALAASGLGIGVLPRQLVDYLPNGHLLREIDIGKRGSSPISTLRVKVCWRKADEEMDAIRRVVQTIRMQQATA